MNIPPRTYVVTDRETRTERLVRASNPASAIRHVTRGRYFARAATTDDAIRLYEAGVRAEVAGEEPPTTEEQHMSLIADEVRSLDPPAQAA